MKSNGSKKSDKMPGEIENLDQLVEAFEPFVTDLYDLVKKHKSPGGLLGSVEDFYPIMIELNKLQTLLRKFTKPISVMFTDIKDSTKIGEYRDDWGAHVFRKIYRDIAEPIIEEKGIKVKDTGNGTMAYFVHAAEAVMTAAKIQNKIRQYNARKKTRNRIHLRIGIHTGLCLVDSKDIYGEVVNVASRIEALAKPGEVYFSEKTFEFLDKNEFKCLEIGEQPLQGKQESLKVFKVDWTEMNLDEVNTKKELPGPFKKKPWLEKIPASRNRKPQNIRIYADRKPTKLKTNEIKKIQQHIFPVGKPIMKPHSPMLEPPLKIKIHPELGDKLKKKV